MRTIVKRYSAKLFFEFRVLINGIVGKRRTCEERIVVIEVASARNALLLAKRIGKQAEHRYDNSEGNPVSFEFVGIMDLLELGPECAENEVWYEIVQRVLPSERRSNFIPAESALNAIRHESR